MRLLSLLLCLGLLTGLTAQKDAYHITFTVDDYEGDILTIANNMLKQQYVVDTLRRAEDGKFHFRDTTALPKGIYLAVMAPENDYFQFLVGNEEPFFSLRGNKNDLATLVPKGSRENKIFFDYLGFLEKQRLADEPLREAAQAPGLKPSEKEKLDAKRDKINRAVLDYQQKLIDEQPASFAAAIVRANRPVTPPDFSEVPEDQRRERQWRWLQRNYFNNLDLGDERLLRTPFLFERIDYFVHKLHVQHPDTIAGAIDRVLRRMPAGSELLKVYLSHFLNEAANSKIVGMDAIYVFLIDNYYAAGLAPWVEADLLRKFTENADRLRPILIGKTAPDITVQARDGTPVNLYETDSEYTILYFWQYECGHCKKSTPVMKEFQAKWKERGVTLFALCTKTGKEVPGCWEYIDEKEINDWLHTVDPYMQSRYGVKYDVTSTPSIFVLDRDKKIISKRLAAEQLDDFMTRLTSEVANQNSGR